MTTRRALPQSRRVLGILTLVLLAVANSLATAAAESISVVDDLGREVVLARPARRIVALSPHIVENLYSAGLGDAIVATVNFADYPASAKEITRLGGFANFSIEAILGFEPDLVIGWASGYADFAQLVKQLEKLGVAVYVDEPHTLAAIAHSIRQFGRLGGTEVHAERAATDFKQRLQGLREAVASDVSDRMPVSVFYPIWSQPLQTLNGEHIVSDVIRLCAGDNIFQHAPVLAPQVNIESVLERDPELIVASASSGAKPAWLDAFLKWDQITAVKNGDVYWIDGDLLSRHTVRMLDGVEMMCSYIARARSHRGKATP